MTESESRNYPMHIGKYTSEVIMPIKIPGALPAKETLEQEHIFVMDEDRASTQDIRPLRIAILNLMPTKIATETQLIRLLSNSPLQIELTLLRTVSHESKNTSDEHMRAFYKSFFEVERQKFDGLIITGAPVEKIDFSEVDYWNELCRIMEWSKTHVYSTFHICWASQAGLYFHYGIQKHPLEKKLSGVFEHRPINPKHPLLRGFDDVFLAPHSRYTGVKPEEIERVGELDILAMGKRSGVYIAASKDCRMFFVSGHSEYERDTLKLEYERDVAKGIDPEIPENYFPDNDPTKQPLYTWRSHANLLFGNWLNYFVYQRTPYDIESIGR